MPEGNCIHMGNAGEYFHDVGGAPYITYDELMKKLDYLDGTATYHMGSNCKDVMFICNCCIDDCGFAMPFKNSPNHKLSDGLAPSRFISTNIPEKCQQCGTCAAKCPFEAINNIDAQYRVDPAKCFGCGVCVINCPQKALKMKLIRPAEYIPEYGGQMIEMEIVETLELPENVTSALLNP
jgi:electron transport complex protein RnfB